MPDMSSKSSFTPSARNGVLVPDGPARDQFDFSPELVRDLMIIRHEMRPKSLFALAATPGIIPPFSKYAFVRLINVNQSWLAQPIPAFHRNEIAGCFGLLGQRRKDTQTTGPVTEKTEGGRHRFTAEARDILENFLKIRGKPGADQWMENLCSEITAQLAAKHLKISWGGACVREDGLVWMWPAPPTPKRPTQEAKAQIIFDR